MYSIGQKVICVAGKYSACGVPVIEGHIYEVRNIMDCKCSTLLDVGIAITTDVTCFKCNTFLSRDGTWWLYARRFVPLDEWEKADENLRQLLKVTQEPILLSGA